MNTISVTFDIDGQKGNYPVEIEKGRFTLDEIQEIYNTLAIAAIKVMKRENIKP